MVRRPMEVSTGSKSVPIVIWPMLLIKFRSIKVLELEQASKRDEVQPLPDPLDEMHKQGVANNKRKCTRAQ